MVRAGDASRNTAFTSPQGWVGEIVSRVRAGGFLTFEYHMWRDQKSKDNGEPPFLLNNHKAQIRATHHRVRTDTDGKLVHRGDGVTPIALSLIDADAFLEADSRAFRWTGDQKRLDEWTDLSGRKLQPFVFASYSGIDEALDPQWLRDTVTLSEPDQVMRHVLDFLARAERYGWEGDRRGTTLNLQVGASGADGQCQGTVGSPPTTYSATTTSGTIGTLSTGAGIGSDCWALFGSVSGLSGATVNSAVFSLNGFNTDGGTPQTLIQAADSASPTSPADVTEFNAVSLTTASVAWDDLNLAIGSFSGSPDISTVIQELADSYDPSAVLIMHFDDLDTDTLNRSTAQHYDFSSSNCPTLDIDYTAGGGGDPEGSLIRGKLIRGGLLRGGVLVG